MCQWLLKRKLYKMDESFVTITVNEEGKIGLKTNLAYADMYLLVDQTKHQLAAGELAAQAEE